MATGLALGDLLRIRGLIAGCTALTLLALAVAIGAHLRLVQARDAQLQAERQARAALQQLDRIDAERRDYLVRLQRYRELAPAKRQGAEGPVQWLAQLRKAAARRHVSSPQVEFAAPVRVDPAAERNPELRASRMQLRMGLLHEEDLLGLLADLRAGASAPIRVQRCRIERLPADSQGIAGAATTLQAECSIDWLSLHE